MAVQRVGSTWPNVAPRVAAKIIDLLIVIALGLAFPRGIGPVLGFLYSMLCDGFWSGQSLGKKCFGLQVKNVKYEIPASFRDSVVRNAPVGIATFFAIIPIWGWIILFIIGVPLVMIEVYLMARVEKGHRLGDVMADTEVVLVRKRVDPHV